MMSYISIRSKVLILLLFSGISCALVISFLSYSQAESSLKTTIYKHLTSIREAKKRQTIKYFADEMKAFEILSNLGQVAEAMKGFQRGFDESGRTTAPAASTSRLKKYYEEEFLEKLEKNSSGEPVLEAYFPTALSAQQLQVQFIAENPHDLGKKDLLDQPKLPNSDLLDEGLYSKTHKKYHPLMRRMLQRLDYYDIFFIDHRTGNIVYSVFKEADYATSLQNGPYQLSGLAKAYDQIRKKPFLGNVVLVDFEQYAPSYNAPAAFMAAPIFDGSEILGVIAAQLNIDSLNAFMTSSKQWREVGLGESGEVYLVGEDKHLRTSSRFLIEDKEGYLAALRDAAMPKESIRMIENMGISILNQPVKTEASNEVMQGKTGTKIIDDYRNVRVLSSYSPIEIAGLRWGIMAEMDEAEAMAPLHDLRLAILVSLGGITIGLTLFSLLGASVFSRPLLNLQNALKRYSNSKAQDDFYLPVKGTDEFSKLGESFNDMVKQMHSQKELIAQKNHESQRLLRSLLPVVIADRVHGGEVKISEHFPSVTVVYVTIGYLTSALKKNGESRSNANQSIAILNQLVDSFDEVLDQRGLERISTSGDTYVAVSGMNVPRLDHAKHSLNSANNLLKAIARFNRTQDLGLSAKIGLASGMVDAGIVGSRHHAYEIFGEAVMVARQLSTLAEPDTIYISQSTYDEIRLPDLFEKQPSLKHPELGTIGCWKEKTRQIKEETLRTEVLVSARA